MATWQYDFYLAPPRSSGTHRADRAPEARLPEGYRDRLAEFLPRAGSWHAHLELWGEEDASCVQIWHLGGGRAAVLVRVDVRGPFTTFLRSVLDLAEWVGLWPVQAEGREPLPPDLEWLSEVIRRSHAARYVENPALYLRRVELGGWEDA